MKTIIDKDPRNGWQARTEIEINPKLQLEISTRRDIAGKLTSRASVWHLIDGSRRHTFGCGSHTEGDYACRITTTHPARIMEKTVAEQHEQSLTYVELIKANAAEHDARQAAAKELNQREPSAMEA